MLIVSISTSNKQLNITISESRKGNSKKGIWLCERFFKIHTWSILKTKTKLGKAI